MIGVSGFTVITIVTYYLSTGCIVHRHALAPVRLAPDRFVQPGIRYLPTPSFRHLSDPRSQSDPCLGPMLDTRKGQPVYGLPLN